MTIQTEELRIQDEFADAAFKYDLKKIENLLKERGAKTFYAYRTGGKPLLNLAANYGDLPLVEVLIENGWDVNGLDDEGENALHSAIYAQEIELFLYLIEKGIDINYQSKTGRTVMMTAIIETEMEKVEILYEKGINMNLKDKEGNTVLNYMMEDIDPEDMDEWIFRFLKEPERFDTETWRILQAKRLELLYK